MGDQSIQQRLAAVLAANVVGYIQIEYQGAKTTKSTE